MKELALSLSFGNRVIVGVGFAARFSMQLIFPDLIGRPTISIMAESLVSVLAARCGLIFM